jgi:hypothetical protein
MTNIRLIERSAARTVDQAKISRPLSALRVDPLYPAIEDNRDCKDLDVTLEGARQCLEIWCDTTFCGDQV